MSKALVVLCCVVCVGCAAKLKAKGGDASDGAGPGVKSGSFTSKTVADAATVTTVDATSDKEWQRLDLDTGESVGEDEGWELAFSRFRVLTNGGVTGDRDVAMALLNDTAFDAVTEVPSDATFEVDHEDSEADANKDADNIFNGPGQSWYAYNDRDHTLKPHDDTYVIRSSERSYFKLRFEDYYDEAGTSGMLRFRWAEIEE